MIRRLLLPALALSMALLAAVAPATTAQDAADISLVPVEEPLFGIRSAVPAGWNSMRSGVHARGTPPDDLAVLDLQGAPISAEQLWPNLLPQLALSEIPEATGELSTEAFEWTFYAFPVDLPSVSLSMEVALAEKDGSHVPGHLPGGRQRVRRLA